MPLIMSPNEWMTSDEVAALLRCTPRTLWNWRQAGRLRPRRVGRRWLYRRSDVLRALGSDENAAEDNSETYDPNIMMVEE